MLDALWTLRFSPVASERSERTVGQGVPQIVGPRLNELDATVAHSIPLHTPTYEEGSMPLKLADARRAISASRRMKLGSRVATTCLALAAPVAIIGCGSSNTTSSATSGANSGANAASGASNPALHSVPSQWAPAKNFAGVVVSTKKYKKPAPWTIAWLGIGPSNGYGLTEATAVKYAASHDPKIKKFLYAVDNNNPTTQVNALEAFAAQKPDAIVMTPASTAGLVAPIARVMKSGIPVILCENAINGGDFVNLSTIDLWNSAYVPAKALAEMLGGKGNVIIFNGIAGIDTSDTWQAAAEAAFKQYPGIKIVAQPFGQYSVATARSEMTALIAKYPKIDGIYAGGGEHAEGAILALRQAGRPMPAFGVSNSINGFLGLAKAFHIRFVAYPNPAAMSATCLRQAEDVLEGKPVKKFNNVTSEMAGASPFDQSQVSQRYVPALSDDFDGPSTNGIPVSAYAAAGLGRH